MSPKAEPTIRPDRAKMISVRLTREEFEALATQAEDLGVGPSTLARTLIRQGLAAPTAPRTARGSVLEAELAANLLARVEALERWTAEH